MGTDKKDLTRIEDLAEFIHELSEDEELPDLPMEQENSFTTEDEPFSVPELPVEEDEPIDFGTSDFATTDFGSNEEVSFESEAFSTTDFETEVSQASTEEIVFPNESIEEESLFSGNSYDTPLETIEPEPEPEPKVVIEIPRVTEEKTLIPSLEAPPEQTYQPSENFEDLKKFAESTSFTGMGVEGNPSFSVLIREIRYVEDVHDILILLKELNLVSDSEEQMRARLMRGNLLVPRISEYAAILLAHKLRRFDIDIQVGLSDEIHPPKHNEAPETGLVSKHSLYQNQTHHFQFDETKVDLSQIIVAATSSLEGYQIIRYLGVASEHKMLDGQIVEDETSSEIPRHYQELAHKLKAHAMRVHGNAVVGINYQLTPLPSEYGLTGSKYRLTCTGNLVWINKL